MGLSSFSTALSALATNTTAIAVTGNNLANLNTVGFKTNEVSFHDLVTQSIGADLGATQVGFGVGTPTTMAQFTQGAIQSTGGPLDSAIQGDGFFVVQNAQGAIEYTRAGNFQTDQNGNLTTATGEQVQGWTINNGVLNTNAPVGPITVPVGSLAAPQATSNASADLNLNSTGATGSSFSTSVQVYDSQGNAHTLTYTFTKSATPNQWTYSVGITPSDTTPAGTPITGTLTFNSNGQLTSPAPNAPPVLSISGLNSGASNMTVTWNLYNGSTPRITQYAQSSAVSAIAQNGAPAANLDSVGLGNGGRILASYSNGQQVVVGQVAMATIRNPASLVAVGDNNYQTSAATALPAIGLPGTGGRGTVQGGSIEASTVNMATEFTNLIVFQRAYEANAHVVTVANQLSQDTINLTQ